VASPDSGSSTGSGSWPVARRYLDGDRARISLPVGGIGTGTIGFGGRGQLRDWELENHPSKGLTAPLSFLACHVAGTGAGAGPGSGLAPVARVLEGVLFDEEIGGAQGATAPLAGLPRFASCEFETAYPFGRVTLTDPGFPVVASVEAWNPLVPGDEEASGLPLAVFRVRLDSVANEPLSVSVMLSIEALAGHSARTLQLASGPFAAPRSLAAGSAGPAGVSGGLAGAGLLLGDELMDTGDEEWGTIAAAVLGDGAWTGPAWGYGKWNQGLFAMWQGFAATGRPEAGMWSLGGPTPSSDPGSGSAIAGTLGAERVLEPGGHQEFTFVLGWHFPNRRSWVWTGPGPRGGPGPEIVGNHYATLYTDAWDVIAQQAPRLAELRVQTERFVGAFWASSLPLAVKEAALFNLSTLRSQTYFRTADGWPFGWEGCLDEAGSCLGSCTHVWNYDLATGFLFGGLAQRMRELEYRYGTGADGAMSFRLTLPLDRARELGQVAADGQFGCVIKLYREWMLSGDDAWLAALWPACRRSVEFAWIDGGWDADRDGLAEGAQHVTMDVEYYGPNAPVQGLYLAALAAAAAMASAVGDEDFAWTCSSLRAAGAAAAEARLFNGSYYQQEVIPPGSFDRVAPRLRNNDLGAERADHPEFQIGDGCITDQLMGDTYARIAGIGPVFDPDHAATALASIHRLNYVPDFGDWTTYVRSYAVAGERGHIVLSYPGGLPEHPAPYWSEAWTGLEYVLAMGLAQHGFCDLARDAVAAVRERFDGARRNPFDEAECGHHYARALASWGVLVALTGFGYDGRSGVMSFATADLSAEPVAALAEPGADGALAREPEPGAVTWFWANGSAWGTVRQSLDAAGVRAVSLEVLHGSVRVERVLVGGEEFGPAEPGVLAAGSACQLSARG
jgi:non-lysosomal glucosylceramidase